MIAHDRDWLYLTCDLGTKMSLEEFDKLSRKRIKRLIELQEQRLKEQAEAKEAARKEAERQAKREQAMRNTKHGHGSVRISADTFSRGGTR